MSLYQRAGSPFWWYTFSHNGVRFRGSTGQTDKRKAGKVEREKQFEAENKKAYKEAWRVRDCFGAYWEDHAKHRRANMFILRKLDALSRLLGKDKLIAELTNADILDYRAKRRGEGLQAHSVNRDFNCLKAALNHANQMHGQQIPALAWRRLRADEPDGRTRFLSQKEYARLLEAADPALQRIIIFAVATGLRKSNILNLDWSEVELSSGSITVIIKGDKRHLVRMTPELRAMLATSRIRTGKVFDTSNFRKKWDKARKDAEVLDFRFHDLRHTFASWARMAGADLADVCDALGHSNVTVTMRYAHIEPKHHKSAFDRVSADVWSQSATHSRKNKMK